MLFPTLKVSLRSREFDAYQIQERAKVVYEYLFNGHSHRWLDANVLNQDAVESRGWHSMGILHHLGLVNKHKGFFKNFPLQEAISYLELCEDTAYREIVGYLRLYLTTQQLPQSTHIHLKET